MANTRTARRFPLAAWLFVLAGVLILLELLLNQVAANPLDKWLIFLADVALTVSFVVMFLWRSVDILLRVAFIVAAVGFALFALGNIAALGTGVGTVADVLVLVGFLVSGIMVFVRHVFSRLANLVFLILGILVALLYLSFLTGVLSGAVLALTILVGAGLVITGVLITRRK